MKKKEVIERIMRDDPRELRYNEIFKDPTIRDTYWKLIIKHHAISTLHKFRHEEFIEEKLMNARKEKDWRAIRTYLDSTLEYLEDYVIGNIEEYQYLWTKGVDIDLQGFYPGDKIYLFLTVGLDLGCSRLRIVTNTDPSIIYHLQITIDPLRRVDQMTSVDYHKMCLYDNITPTQYRRWTGDELGNTKYYPLLKRQIVNRDPGMDLDRLFLDSLSLDIPQLHHLLRSVDFQPSENMRTRVKTILGMPLT